MIRGASGLHRNPVIRPSAAILWRRVTRSSLSASHRRNAHGKLSLSGSSGGQAIGLNSSSAGLSARRSARKLRRVVLCWSLRPRLTPVSFQPVNAIPLSDRAQQMSLADGDLTTVANAQFWINSPNPALVQSLISRVSTQIRSWLGRPFLYSKSYSKTFDGTGTSKLMLPDWPVTSVSSVQIGPNIVQPVPLQLAQSVVTLTFPPFGYRYRGWDGGVPGYTTAIELLDGWFGKGHQDVMVDYTAGYLVAASRRPCPRRRPMWSRSISRRGYAVLTAASCMPQQVTR